jgi:hypothetical protein
MSVPAITTSRVSGNLRTFNVQGHGIHELLAQAEMKLKEQNTLISFVSWAARVAGYQKILGLPVGPFFAYLDGRVFDFDTVQFKPDGSLELQMREPTEAELQRISEKPKGRKRWRGS